MAGHVIECGAQCCGGNYAFFEEIPDTSRIGFPLAELYPDGSSVITKHPGTGGALTVGTVTAQLLYEIGGPRYLSPDAVARFDTMAVEQVGPDRVRISKVEGEPPPSTLKVTANLDGGWRNSMTLAIPDRGSRRRLRWPRRRSGRASRGPRRVRRDGRGPLGRSQRRAAWRFCGWPCAATTRMRWAGGSPGAVVETSLSSYPGIFFTSAPGNAQAVARYWPTTIAAGDVTPRVECEGQPVVASPSTRRPTTQAPETLAQPTSPTSPRHRNAGSAAARRPPDRQSTSAPLTRT